MRFQSTPAPYPSTPLSKTLFFQTIGATGALVPQSPLVVGAAGFKSVRIHYAGDWNANSLVSVSWLNESASRDVAHYDNWYPAPDNASGSWEMVLDVKAPTMQISLLSADTSGIAQLAIIGYSDRIPPGASQDNQTFGLMSGPGQIMSIVATQAAGVVTNYPLPLWSGAVDLEVGFQWNGSTFTFAPFAAIGRSLLAVPNIGAIAIAQGIDLGNQSFNARIPGVQLPRAGVFLQTYTGVGPASVNVSINMVCHGSEDS